MRTAVITGGTGQDGRYAADLLLDRGYRIFATTRNPRSEAASHMRNQGVEIAHWDLRDTNTFSEILDVAKPTEVYNFAAYSTGTGMYDEPEALGDVNGLAVTRILETIRCVDPTIRFCQASSSEMFGEPLESPQSEGTSFNPRSPYGAAKLYAHMMVNIYRQRFGLFACSAILFNHESPRRSLDFVTRKVTHAAASIRLGLASELTLGNLDAKRDWGFAGDYVRAMWLMLQAPRPDDYVVATGKTHSVRDLCSYAFEYAGLDYRNYVREDSSSYRPAENRQLVGNPSKATRELGWLPETEFPDLIRIMVDADLERLCRRD